MSERTLHLDPHELTIVQQILAARVPERTVYAFGSRTSGNSLRRSDLDLAVDGSCALTLREQGELADDFDQSDLSITVDVVDLAAITPAFRNRIEKDFVVVQAGSPIRQEALV